MQNPESLEDSRNNAPPGAQGNQSHDSTDESPQSHSRDATNAPPPTQMPPMMMMMPPQPPPIPPFHPPMMMMPHPQFQFPSNYLNYQLPFQPYGYTMIFPAPNIFIEKRSWSTGLFDCFSDLKNCFITTFCPCVTFGQISEILNEGHTAWWEGAIVYILVEIVMVNMGAFLCVWAYRAKMRKKHLLKGSHFWDLIFSFFCTRLSLCQLYRQLDRLGYNVPLGWIANKDKQIYGAMENRFQVVPPAVESGMFR